MVRLRDSWRFSLSSAPTVGNPCRPLQPESVSLTCYTASSKRRMDLFAITISINDGKGRVVLADQAHDEASSSRIELRFPLGTKPEADFATREEQIIRD